MVKSPVAVFEDSQVFQPLRAPRGDWNKKDELRAEDAYFLTEDKLQLHGWHLPHEDKVAVVLFAHGNTGNVTTQAETLRLLHDRHRLSVMTFDYRGYGRSEGIPSEEGILRDARAARKWLAWREKIDEKDIVLVGQSLGGGVMVDLAARDGARGLILADTFTSLVDVGRHHAPLLPVDSLMQNRFESVAKIGDYDGPLLQFHGDRDKVIPYRLGRKLFDAANQPKRLITRTGGGHNDAMTEAQSEALDEFLASLKPLKAAGSMEDRLAQSL
jgi:hypothetical protein